MRSKHSTRAHLLSSMMYIVIVLTTREHCQIAKYSMFNLKDFNKMTLPHHWWYILDFNGHGKAVDFPLNMKPYLARSPKHFIVEAGKLTEAPQMPLEMASLIVSRKACSRENLPR